MSIKSNASKQLHSLFKRSKARRNSWRIQIDRRGQCGVEPLENRVLLSFSAGQPTGVPPLLGDGQGQVLPLRVTDGFPRPATPVQVDASGVSSPRETLALDTTSLGGGHELDETGMAPNLKEVFYLDMDGARGVRYVGPVVVDNIDVAAFRAPSQLAGQERAIESALLTSLRRAFPAPGVSFTTQRPRRPPPTPPSTSAATAWLSPATASISGWPRRSIPGTGTPATRRLVFSDLIGASARTPGEYGRELAVYVSHEAGHLLGYRHAYDSPASAANPLDEVAWKPYTHVEIAKDVRRDLLSDGTLEIGGNSYAIHPRILQAIKEYPAFYFAGSVGPDGFPDLTFGQHTLHPVDTGTWVTRLFDMAWAAQAEDAPYTEQEKLQILAFTYGFATHAASDALGHTLINEFAEGVFPAVVDIVQDDRDLSNAVRHLMAEAYVGDATPGADMHSDRTLLPNGDISSDATHGIVLDVPTRFLYEALLKPFPEDPTARNDGVDHPARGHGDQFLRAQRRRKLCRDQFELGQLIYAFGFNANNTKYTVLDVTPTSIRVAEPLAAGDAASAADRALVTRGDRGPILDVFIDLQRTIDTVLATLGGARPKRSMRCWPAIAQLPAPDPALLADLNRSYLANWSAAIDDGIRHWADLGLAAAKGLFDADAKRHVQNEEGESQGARRGSRGTKVEGEVGTVDTIMAYLEDANGDGDHSDSFVTNHLLPMLGMPADRSVAHVVAELGEFLDDQIVGPRSWR